MRRIDLRIGVVATALSVVLLSSCATSPPTAIEISDAVPIAAPDAPVFAPHPPPPTRVEIPPTAPSPQALWRFGHWSWNGKQFVWTPGQYVERPSPAASWIPGYWEQRPDGWIRIDDQWAS